MPIVNVNVTLQEAPTPSTLQGTGALISQGGTNTSPGTMTLLTQPSSLTPYLTVPEPIASLTSTAGVATATTAEPHGFTIGSTLSVVVSGATLAAYNGTFTVTATTADTFTYPVASGTASPASGTITYLPASANELSAMVTTFFGQGTGTAVYILECGAGNANTGMAFLNSWITANPGVFYGYLVPREWDGNANFLSLLAQFESTTAMTYFWTTTTLATYSLYSDLMKCVVAMIEAPVFGAYSGNVLSAISWTGGVVTATTSAQHGVTPGMWFQIAGVSPSGYNGWFQAQAGTTGSTLVYDLATNPGSETVLGTLVTNLYASSGIPSTEFSLATAFNAALSFNPAGFVPPFGYAFLYGVTPFPVRGNNALLATLATAGVNVVGTGAEGGISNTILLNGTTMDGNSFNFWYAIDWLNINVNLNISNAVINGSNTTLAPLYLNQAGINALQGVGAATISSGITAGLIYGTMQQAELSGPAFAAAIAAGIYDGVAVINAVPFATYYAANPGQYKTRTYQGFSISFTPQNGFENITFNLDATQFVE
jgi:hypothetical protein